MVPNSFGSINFMQPMGRPKHALKVPSFFLLKFGEGRIFFHVSLAPNVFSLCSFQVPNEISLGSSSSHCVPQHVLRSTSLLSHMLWQMLSSFHLYRWAKEEELYTSK